MTYLDTHVAVWLHEGRLELLTQAARRQVEEEDDLRVSPAVLLELEYLNEIGRFKASALTAVAALSKDLGVRICDLPFPVVVEHALKERWVRDPFDRLIVAHAKANRSPLVTKDEQMRQHYRLSVW